MEKWEDILVRVADGARLSSEEALTLWQDAPLWRLAEVAVEKKRSISADKVFYNKNFHIYSNPFFDIFLHSRNLILNYSQVISKVSPLPVPTKPVAAPTSA